MHAQLMESKVRTEAELFHSLFSLAISKSWSHDVMSLFHVH